MACRDGRLFFSWNSRVANETLSLEFSEEDMIAEVNSACYLLLSALVHSSHAAKHLDTCLLSSSRPSFFTQWNKKTFCRCIIWCLKCSVNDKSLLFSSQVSDSGKYVFGSLLKVNGNVARCHSRGTWRYLKWREPSFTDVDETYFLVVP